MSHLPRNLPGRPRGIYTNRTLNLRSIKAIGYDMDYTLVHYHVEAWEGHAYEHTRQKLLERGWPVEQLEFDPKAAMRGLIVDKKLGNLLKVNRFGYIKRAAHGTGLMDYRTMRRTYQRTIVELDNPRFYFLNTLFSISEACIYSQVVELFDEGLIPDVETYTDLYEAVRNALDSAHIEGVMKAEIMANPEDYVDLDPDMPLALLDQKEAGKRLVVITNSEWSYTKFMLSYAFDQFLPGDMTWQDLFEITVVSSRKPSFFNGNNPMLEVDVATGMLKEFVGDLKSGGIYFGGSAARIEKYLGCSGDQILYVGDHLFTDVNVTKSVLRWRTALIMRELEEELVALDAARSNQEKIARMMERKELLEDDYSQLRLSLQRLEAGYGPQPSSDVATLKSEMAEVRDELVALDDRIAPLVIEDGHLFNPRWSYLLRTGKDKSHLTRQMERYADIYTSRVSNFLYYTPFMYFRAPKGSIPHDN
jgi:HAD superfamily 5'-nucleotidase-like hydrolase